jgi:hypothetical protein
MQDTRVAIFPSIVNSIQNPAANVDNPKGESNLGNGHEFQHQAPANWTATLHRGGVLRVKTRPKATIFGKRGSN